MKALVLAAGLGTRLRPLTATIPKCLVPVQGRPLLDHWLELLTRGGVSPILVNLHHFADRVLEHLERGPYAGVVRTVREETLLGTGGTVLRNAAFFGQEPFLLIHGDNLSRFPLRDFQEAHRRRPPGCEMTMMLFVTPTPHSCGIVRVDDRGVVQEFHEKVADPPGNLANGAVYILEPTVLEFLRGLGRAVIDFSTEVIPRFLGRIHTYTNTVFHRDIGTLESYQAAVAEFSRLPDEPPG
ncbi:MAG: nucleotidyltransferase family protein [Candidatus Riflebacteria bacterium]|nr:nucleotidyltransferase family protein [Candidatus Riflebacteria bacterium]